MNISISRIPCRCNDSRWNHQTKSTHSRIVDLIGCGGDALVARSVWRCCWAGNTISGMGVVIVRPGTGGAHDIQHFARALPRRSRSNSNCHITLCRGGLYPSRYAAPPYPSFASGNAP
jgi:hypothetical protein